MGRTIKISNDRKNNTPYITEIFRTVEDGTTISFENGIYNFYADGAKVEYLCPVCNKSSEKKIIFPIFDKKDIIIDGNGSEFVFCDRVFPFAVLNCENITLKNFSINFSFMRYILADVTCDDKGILLNVGKGKIKCSANQNGNLTVIVGDEEFSTSEKYFFMQQEQSVCFLCAGKRYYEPNNLPARFIDTVAENVKGGIYLKYRDTYTEKPFFDGEIVISYDEDRQNDNIFFERCKNVRVDNVKLYRGAGMGIVTQLCENVDISHVDYTAGKDGNEVYSTTADGLFFTNDMGKVRICGCKINSTMDDAISIHNVYSRVEKVVSERKAAVRFQHKSHSGYNPYFVGDEVIISDKDTLNEKGRAKIKSSFMGNDTYEVMLEFAEDITEKINSGDYVENHYRSPEVIIDNNLFDNFPRIRLASAKKMIFRNNIVRNANSLSINDMLKYWNTYGTSEDVEITGNKFENCDTAISIFVDRGRETKVYHGKIKIINNLIKNCQTGIKASHVAELKTGNNYFVNTSQKTEIKNCLCTEEIPVKQLLMRRDLSEFKETELPKGYSKFTFHRGGDERMSEDEYRKGWFNVAPHWTRQEFDNFYKDPRIPNDGFFLIKNEDGEIVAHSNVQLNEHKQSTATVHFVAVKENCRGKKLGYVATEQVLEYVQEHRIPTLYLTTDEFRIPAIKTYLKLGFKPVMWDIDMRERWFPILKELGYDIAEIYDENERMETVQL